MDILWKQKGKTFSYRVAGIVRQDDKILLQRPKNDDYAIIGGHVSFGESSSEALKREFLEELHAQIEVDRLLAIGEIFFQWNQSDCHQICLYYLVHFVDEFFPSEGIFHGYDQWDNERIDLDFCWVPLEQLQEGTKVYPLQLLPYLIEPTDEIVHFVER